MLRSMYSGIGGMKNFQTKLDVIGNNIANVNTFGFKKGRVTFKDIASQTISGASSPTDFRGGTNAMQIGLGATISSVDTIMTNSSLQTTGNPTDLAIGGDGFFIIRSGNQQMYTRAGNFALDQAGNLVNSDGFKVQGYPIDENGNVDRTQLVDMKIDKNTVVPPKATTTVSFSGNLNSGAKPDATSTLPANGEAVDTFVPADDQVMMDMKVRDSLGNEHTIKMVFDKSTDNEWSYKAYTVTDNKFEEVSAAPTPPATDLKLVFDNEGMLDKTASSLSNLSINPGGGADPITILAKDLNFSALTQNSDASNVKVKSIDGYGAGSLESFNISASGTINGVFSNGQVMAIGQLATATFSNPAGLMKNGGNSFIETVNSGMPDIGTPGGQGKGTIAAGTLEMSNVDLSEEFTEMIVAQRGFQANSRIITTSDQILEELVNLKR